MKTKPYLCLMEKLRTNYSVVALLSFLFAGSLPTLADQLTPSEAVARMQNSRSMRKVAGNKQFVLKHTESKGDTALVYVMSSSNDGKYYLLSADDCAPALLGWTEGGNTDTIPDALKWWMNQYSAAVSDAIDNEKSVRKICQRQEIVAPLITTTWGQEEPYNKLCTDISSSGILTGCIATAMAQIMNYYKYPAKGTGSHSYTYRRKTISSNFEEHTYEWDKMLDSYNESGNNVQSENAVALLMRDCGVAVDMGFSELASSAKNVNFANALTTYFGYDEGIRNVYRTKDNISDEDWSAILISELEAGRPIFYTGRNKSGGHAFICDGYNGDGYFHINWGWDGSCNGYFLITGSDALNPYGSTYSTKAYCNDHMIAIGIQPKVTVDNANTEPQAQICCKPFAYSNGIRTINNKVTEDDLTVRLEMDALEDIDDLSISCEVYSAATKKMVASCSQSYSAKEGEKLVVDMKPANELLTVGLDEGEYEIVLKSNSSELIPVEYNNIPVEVVDHMPTISDLPKKIQQLQQGGCTKKDIEDAVFEILNTTKISK